jgi:uncharacterized protein (DUF58 family)
MNSLLNDDFFGRLETLALNLRTNLSGFFGGKHLTKSYGQTVEFSDFREYILGDDIRRIDWNMYSRFEKYFIKLFTDERQMHVQIYLDCSGSMGKHNKTKAQYAVAVAAALGFLSVHNMDKLSFNLMKEGVSEDVSGVMVGKDAFFRGISKLDNIVFSGSTSISEAITSSQNVGNNDGLSVIISDFLTDNDWKKAVDFLSYKKRQILLIQTLAPEELDPTYNGRMHLIDSEAASFEDPKNMKIRITRSMQEAYQNALTDFIADIKAFCSSRGAGFITARTDHPIEKFLFGELLRVGIMA